MAFPLSLHFLIALQLVILLHNTEQLLKTPPEIIAFKQVERARAIDCNWVWWEQRENAWSVGKKCRSCSCAPNAACLFGANVSEETSIFALMMDLKGGIENVVEIWWDLIIPLCLCCPVAHLKAPVFQMNTVTSALISGVIILGVMSVCFFIFSLTLLKGKSTPVSTLSGVRNPAFNWAPEPSSLQTHSRQCSARGKLQTWLDVCACSHFTGE